MKHKAQESLNELCSHAMTYEEDYDYEENECGEYRSLDERELEVMKKPLQNLIDCQLTEEEIGTINTALNHLEVDYELDKTLIIYRTKGLERIESIRNKLNKQKGMWCKDE